MKRESTGRFQDRRHRLRERLRAEDVRGGEEEWRRRTRATDDSGGAGAGATTLSGDL